MKPIQIACPGEGRLDALAEIMVRSNKAAQAAAEQIVGSRKYRLFRAALRGETTVGLTESQLEAIRCLDPAHKKVMLEVEAIRNEVIEAFIPAMYGIANKFAYFNPDHENGDYFGEATLVAVDVVYGYNNLKVKIFTYLRRALVSELNRYARTNRAYGINSHSSHYLDLLSLVLQATEVLESNGQPVNYYSIRSFIEPICRTKKALRDIALDSYLPGILSFVRSGSDQPDSQTDIRERNDYTSDAAQRLACDPSESMQVAELQNVLLQTVTPVERAVLQSRLEGLTLDEVAEKNGLTPKEARNRLTAARLKVKQQLRNYHAA